MVVRVRPERIILEWTLMVRALQSVRRARHSRVAVRALLFTDVNFMKWKRSAGEALSQQRE